MSKHALKIFCSNKKKFNLLISVEKYLCIDKSILFFQEFDFLKRDFDAMKLENEAIKQQMEIKDRLIKVGLSVYIFICGSG